MTALVNQIRSVSYDEELNAVIIEVDADGERVQLGLVPALAEQLVDEIYAWLERDDDFDDDFEDDDLELDW
jgi:hypothetical protein